MTSTIAFVDVERRARLSHGTSTEPIYRAVARALIDRHPGGGTLVDVGCGTGNLWHHVKDQFSRYIGVAVVRYEDFPAYGEFQKIDLDTRRVDLTDETADVVAAVETIEHLENPRAFVRELGRLCKQDGWIVITTPNQLSLLSKLTLIVKNEFNAFQEGSYPAHLTALLKVDVHRIARECGLTEVAFRYTGSGRIPGGSAHYPMWLSTAWPRFLSDNVLMIAQKRNVVLNTGASTPAHAIQS